MLDCSADHGGGGEKDPCCVLVADDDQEMREEIARTLHSDNFQIVEVDSGDHLIRYLRECIVSDGRIRTPDVIVSDIRMPGCSGLEVLRIMREISVDIPVILMTAFGDAATHQEARRLGAMATLDKPFDADDFRAAVLIACSSRG